VVKVELNEWLSTCLPVTLIGCRCAKSNANYKDPKRKIHWEGGGAGGMVVFLVYLVSVASRVPCSKLVEYFN